MVLTNPTLLFTSDEQLEDDLRDQIVEGPTYLVRAPHWEGFSRLVAQLVFGVVIADFTTLADDGGNLDPEKLKQLTEETVESNDHARILVYNVPDEKTFSILIDAGIHNVIRAPVSIEELKLRIQRSGEMYGWLAQRNYYVGKSGHIFQVDDIIGDSQAMTDVLEQVRKIAPSRSPVLITGETGVGKELIAAAIHYNSPRSEQAFIKVNCAALQDTLLESDLFGHEKGSFTGAVRQRIGRFEQAHGGTLFMDEIGEMSSAVQAKVLRVLQNQEFERVGGTRVIRVDARIIAATNRILDESIRTGRFREDLYYRLNVVTIHIPPLREHISDIPLLAHFFLKKARIEERKPVVEFTPDAMEIMQSYPWPGNVRELENTIYQAVLLAEGERIQPGDLAIYHRVKRPGVAVPYQPEADEAVPGAPPVSGQADMPAPYDPVAAAAAPDEAEQELDLKDMEKAAILKALESTAFVQSRAARLLGISRRALNYKIAKYGITHLSWRVHRE
jgi:Nif-specific regulatory protein